MAGGAYQRAQSSDGSRRKGNPVEPLAVDIREAARLTSLSVRTLRRYVGLGRLRVVRVGRRILVPVESLKVLVAETPTNYDAARTSRNR